MEEHGIFAPAGDRRAAMTMLPVSLGRDDRNKTQIVQFQKDQIDRVPPRENGTIVENYRNLKDLRGRRHCPNLLLTITLTLIAIVAIIGITITALYFIFAPEEPTFYITNVVVKNPNAHPAYQVSLNVRNPNKRSGLEYQKDVEVFLLFEMTKVATGKFPWLDQDPGDWNMAMIELIGFDAPLPPQMEKSMKSNDDTPVSLGLDMKLRVKITAARLETWVMKLNVSCVFEVNTLKNDTRVLSQHCQTNFKHS